MPTFALILLLGLLAACDRAEKPAATTDGAAGAEATLYPASYSRRLVFLAGGEGAPVAAIFDFTTQTEPKAVHRTARAWLGRSDGWDPLLEAAWGGEPMREPWRLVPHGPLRLVVGDGDEIEALVHRAEPDSFRLIPAAARGDWSPNPAAQLLLRGADLTVRGERFTGILLESQVGAPPQAGSTAVEAFVTDGADQHLVVAAGPGGSPIAWLRQGEETLTWEAVSLAAPASGSAPAWLLEEPLGTLHGEFRTVGEGLAFAPQVDSLAGTENLHLIRGWIRVRGQRRPVFGVVVRRGE